MKKKVLYIDMDDTIADFLGHSVFEKVDGKDVTPMFEIGFFRSLKPIDGALWAVRALIQMGFDVQILTQPLAHSPHCYSEKVQWIGMWFPELIEKINMVQNKGLLRGHYLIDDNALKWQKKFEENGGKFIHFPYNGGDSTRHSNREAWTRIINFFKEESPYVEP